MTQGSGNVGAPALMLREVLMRGLAALAGDEARLAELVTRLDSLPNGTQDAQMAQGRAFLARALRPGVIPITVGYPTRQSRLPAISIVVDSAAENAGAAVLGDLLAVEHERIGVTGTDGAELFKRESIGNEHNVQLQVGSWSTSPEESALVHEAVRSVLFLEKGRLGVAGVQSVDLSESGFQPDSAYVPETMWVPMHAVRLTYVWRQSRRVGPLRTRVTIGEPQFTGDEW